ncbi:hypothetical protein Efla_007488 [Eimeria flavescens]
MTETKEESPPPSGGPGVLSAADRLLQALEQDYLFTLQAGRRREAAAQPEETHGGPGGEPSGKSEADCKSEEEMTEVTQPSLEAEAPACSLAGKETEEALGGRTYSEAAEQEDSASSWDEAEAEAEFAYQRLPSTEALHSPQSFCDDAADEADNDSAAAEQLAGHLADGEADSGPEGVLTGGLPAGEDDTSAFRAKPKRASPPFSPSSSSLKEEEVEGEREEEDEAKAGEPEAAEESGEERRQRTPSHTAAAAAGRPRPLLLGERPLEPQSAAFISELAVGRRRQADGQCGRAACSSVSV